MRSILVFRIGSLGDTLASLTAFCTICEHFSGNRITLLYDDHPRDRFVAVSEVLKGSALADGFLRYPVGRGWCGGLIRPVRILSLLLKLRRGFCGLGSPERAPNASREPPKHTRGAQPASLGTASAARRFLDSPWAGPYIPALTT